MKFFFGIIVPILLLFNVSYAGITQKKEAPSFAFTADDKVKNFEENETIIKDNSTDIKTDKYWNKPLTKLDYALMQFKKTADETTKKIIKDKEGIYRYFNRLEHPKNIET